MPRWIRALLAFLALPGVVAFTIPALIVWPQIISRAPRTPGLFPFAAGVFLLLWCVRDFFLTGEGTLAPWDPPKHLVAVGLYRISRNPMYVAVSLILIGWALSYRSMSLELYVLAVMMLFHLRVVFGEEPWLERTYGEEWRQYRARVPRWLFHGARTPLIATVLLVAISVAIGALTEWWIQRSAARRFPAPGTMVDVGGRRLHLLCIGEGEPTVMFEASGFGVGSLSAAEVRERVASQTKVCSYDRQGMAWSDPGPAIVTSVMLAQDLLELQRRARLRGPFILVASSVGGLTAEMFTRQHPERVAGLVFLDAATSGALPVAAPYFKVAGAATCALAMTAKAGFIRLIDPFDLSRYRSEGGQRSAAFTYGAKAMGTICAIVEGLPSSMHEFEAVKPLPANLPLVVLSAERPLEFWEPFTNAIRNARLPLHQAFAKQSSRGEWRMVPDSDHLIASSKPNVVADVILTMLADIRTHR
jgi:protein-S-isoprenylcysteine O-methyltransferase Ste14/pimeloyl-ACP methyl ester carboxylesterase